MNYSNDLQECTPTAFNQSIWSVSHLVVYRLWTILLEPMNKINVNAESYIYE